MSHWEVHMEKLLARQARLLELKQKLQREDDAPKPFLTISREFGCAGIRLGVKLAELLNQDCPESQQWAVYDRKIFKAMEEDSHLSARIFEDSLEQKRLELENYLFTTFGVHPEDLFVFRKWSQAIRRLALAGQCILVGRGAHLVTRDLKNSLHIRVVAPFEWRVTQVCESHGLDSGLSHTLVRRRDSERRNYLETYFDRGTADPADSDLVFNNERLSLSEMTELLKHLLIQRGILLKQS